MRLRLLGPAVAAAALVGTTLTAGVASADAPASPVAKAAKPSCNDHFINVPAKQSVKIRKSPKVGSTALGLWPKGKKGDICNPFKPTKGQKYNLCGKKSDKWYYGGPYGKGRPAGWVPAACLNA
ncbi:hypothetical protein [Streptomyces sp. NPDC059009]|uniref:hypothetical protein n=1 Tax=Streptomyces sp. NPDC059009 TaxID=3346694 RepID=UPI0036966BB1